MFSRIENIIKKHIKNYIDSLEILTQESGNEAYTTTTKILNINDLGLVNYGNVIVLFTDIKDSTQILETCENNSILNVYSNYINFSSKLLGEIISLFKGRIIESTGDGIYSIIESTDSEIEEIFKYKYIKDVPYDRLARIIESNVESNFYEVMHDKTYLNIFSDSENTYILKKLEDISSIDEKLRTLFFIIFAKFNSKINNIDSLKKHNIKFATRIGCKIGSCKITNITVDGHINQDKLIGTVVHNAAHQASGKS